MYLQQHDDPEGRLFTLPLCLFLIIRARFRARAITVLAVIGGEGGRALHNGAANGADPFILLFLRIGKHVEHGVGSGHLHSVLLTSLELGGFYSP